MNITTPVAKNHQNTNLEAETTQRIIARMQARGATITTADRLLAEQRAATRMATKVEGGAA